MSAEAAPAAAGTASSAGVEKGTADGVFSGGGIKGLAFAGALTATEKAGYKHWHELAGTSAGAITAMALAAGYNAKQLTDSLEAFDFERIADYGSPIHVLGALRNLIFHESVVEGDALTEWIQKLLDDAPVEEINSTTTFGELAALTGRTLVVVGTDLAHSRVVEFPREVELYQDKDKKTFVPDAFPVWKAVRISAGYPYFFPPVGGLFDRSTEQQGVFVDGGVAGNFPVFVFDKPAPKHPTWGFHLHGGRDAQENEPSYHKIGGIDWPKPMLEAILDTAMNALDKFTERRFESRVIPIPTGEVSTLNFNLSKQEREYLLKSGEKAAEEFFARSPVPENSYGK